MVRFYLLYAELFIYDQRFHEIRNSKNNKIKFISMCFNYYLFIIMRMRKIFFIEINLSTIVNNPKHNNEFKMIMYIYCTYLFCLKNISGPSNYARFRTNLYGNRGLQFSTSTFYL